MGKGCDFCHWRELTAADTFGRVENEHAVSASNLFKISGLHGVLLFKHHHPLEFSEAQMGGAGAHRRRQRMPRPAAAAAARLPPTPVGHLVRRLSTSSLVKSGPRSIVKGSSCRHAKMATGQMTHLQGEPQRRPSGNPPVGMWRMRSTNHTAPPQRRLCCSARSARAVPPAAAAAGLLDCGEHWLAAAAAANPDATHPALLWNCGGRAGASQFHGHAQVMPGILSYLVVS